ncbi:MAG TPA: phosphoenolpyruvate hydrolase family protein [Microvirga sp.]|nr:phosphoenolpyruvate hydrolase family protein [Microvirga sp.]
MTRLEICTCWESRDLPHSLYLPALRGLEGGDLDLLAMLPVCDVNGDLARQFAFGAPWPVPGPAPVAGLFMLDPFLRLPDMATALRAAGIGAVANYPTIQVLEGETANGLASVGLSPAQEFEVLREFGRLGFAMVAFATGAAAARELAAAGARTVVLHPGPRPGPRENEAVATMSAWLKPELMASGTSLLAFSPQEGVARAV